MERTSTRSGFQHCSAQKGQASTRAAPQAQALRCAGREHRPSVGFAEGIAEGSERQSVPTIVEGQEHTEKPRMTSSVSMSNLNHGLYIILISLHGLVRGDRMELGKDPDTGGQVQQTLHSCKFVSLS